MNNIIQYGKLILIFFLVFAVGFIALNQGLGAFQKAKLMLEPCDICQRINPQYQACFESMKYGTRDPLPMNLSELDIIDPSLFKK